MSGATRDMASAATRDMAGAATTRTLVVIRHAKSDWSVDTCDRDRPLARRGRRQAPETGRWLVRAGIVPKLALVSPAARARQTWALVSVGLGRDVPVRVEEAAYTFAGRNLLALVRGLPDDTVVAALVGHNPAVEELVDVLTGEWTPMPTSALAVVELDSWTGRGGLIAAGRPADGDVGMARLTPWRDARRTTDDYARPIVSDARPR